MTNPETALPATVPPSMSRAAKAEALLLRFTAEAHRRKWDYDRGLDGDGVPVRSEAFDALHRLGEEMRVALEELRRMPAAVSVPPPAPRADVLRELVDKAADWDGHITVQELRRMLAAEERQPTASRCVAGEQQNETPEAETPTTTKPETAADRAALRRQFGDVLRHWGLLDEQIDQKAAEEYAVTDLLALLPEQTSRDAETEHLRDRLASCRERVGIAADKAIAAEDAIARARRARRRLTSALIAVEPLLAEPYPDDPRWTPWTRFVGPALKELSDALKTGPAANDGPPAAGVRQDGAQPE